jgi:hypothetical protein
VTADIPYCKARLERSLGWMLGIDTCDHLVCTGDILTRMLGQEVPDDYDHLPYKVRAICRLALRLGAPGVYKCDDDTIVTGMLPALGHDYAGVVSSRSVDMPYCLGMFYWLGRRALEIVAGAEPTPQETAEDRWVGRLLQGAGITPVTLEWVGWYTDRRDRRKCVFMNWYEPDGSRREGPAQHGD